MAPDGAAPAFSMYTVCKTLAFLHIVVGFYLNPAYKTVNREQGRAAMRFVCGQFPEKGDDRYVSEDYRAHRPWEQEHENRA